MRVAQYSQIDSIGVSGDKKGLHWYQWYDWYQWSGWVQGNSNGPLVPMVRLLPIEKRPMGDKKGLQWYQWYDWYQ